MQIAAFSTDRFLLDHWRPLVQDADSRRSLEISLTEVLTPRVLAHLPDALHLELEEGAVSKWIDARDAESDVLTIHSKADRRLIGLVILAADPDAVDRSVMHVGYLFAERVWGQGAASEVLKGLVAALRKLAPIRLVGGVDGDNPASARVLEKAGFAQDPILSTPHGEIYTLDVE